MSSPHAAVRVGVILTQLGPEALDVIMVHTLDRLGRTVREVLNLIHDLRGRGIGLRNLADPIRVDTTNPEDPMGQLAVVLLALFAGMERTYTVERAAHARHVVETQGRRVGRPSVVSDDQLEHATLLRSQGYPMSEITAKNRGEPVHPVPAPAPTRTRPHAGGVALGGNTVGGIGYKGGVNQYRSVWDSDQWLGGRYESGQQPDRPSRREVSDTFGRVAQTGASP